LPRLHGYIYQHTQLVRLYRLVLVYVGYVLVVGYVWTPHVYGYGYARSVGFGYVGYVYVTGLRLFGYTHRLFHTRFTVVTTTLHVYGLRLVGYTVDVYVYIPVVTFVAVTFGLRYVYAHVDLFVTRYWTLFAVTRLRYGCVYRFTRLHVLRFTFTLILRSRLRLLPRLVTFAFTVYTRLRYVYPHIHRRSHVHTVYGYTVVTVDSRSVYVVTLHYVPVPVYVATHGWLVTVTLVCGSLRTRLYGWFAFTRLRLFVYTGYTLHTRLRLHTLPRLPVYYHGCCTAFARFTLVTFTLVAFGYTRWLFTFGYTRFTVTGYGYGLRLHFAIRYVYVVTHVYVYVGYVTHFTFDVTVLFTHGCWLPFWFYVLRLLRLPCVGILRLRLRCYHRYVGYVTLHLIWLPVALRLLHVWFTFHVTLVTHVYVGSHHVYGWLLHTFVTFGYTRLRLFPGYVYVYVTFTVTVTFFTFYTRLLDSHTFTVTVTGYGFGWRTFTVTFGYTHTTLLRLVTGYLQFAVYVYRLLRSYLRLRLVTFVDLFTRCAVVVYYVCYTFHTFRLRYYVYVVTFTHVCVLLLRLDYICCRCSYRGLRLVTFGCVLLVTFTVTLRLHVHGLRLRYVRSVYTFTFGYRLRDLRYVRLLIYVTFWYLRLPVALRCTFVVGWLRLRSHTLPVYVLRCWLLLRYVCWLRFIRLRLHTFTHVYVTVTFGYVRLVDLRLRLRWLPRLLIWLVTVDLLLRLRYVGCYGCFTRLFFTVPFTFTRLRLPFVDTFTGWLRCCTFTVCYTHTRFGYRLFTLVIYGWLRLPRLPHVYRLHGYVAVWFHYIGLRLRSVTVVGFTRLPLVTTRLRGLHVPLRGCVLRTFGWLVGYVTRLRWFGLVDLQLFVDVGYGLCPLHTFTPRCPVYVAVGRLRLRAPRTFTFTFTFTLRCSSTVTVTFGSPRYRCSVAIYYTLRCLLHGYVPVTFTRWLRYVDFVTIVGYGLRCCTLHVTFCCCCVYVVGYVVGFVFTHVLRLRCYVVDYPVVVVDFTFTACLIYVYRCYRYVTVTLRLLQTFGRVWYGCWFDLRLRYTFPLFIAVCLHVYILPVTRCVVTLFVVTRWRYVTFTLDYVYHDTPHVYHVYWFGYRYVWFYGYWLRLRSPFTAAVTLCCRRGCIRLFPTRYHTFTRFAVTFVYRLVTLRLRFTFHRLRLPAVTARLTFTHCRTRYVVTGSHLLHTVCTRLLRLILRLRTPLRTVALNLRCVHGCYTFTLRLLLRIYGPTFTVALLRYTFHTRCYHGWFGLLFTFTRLHVTFGYHLRSHVCCSVTGYTLLFTFIRLVAGYVTRLRLRLRATLYTRLRYRCRWLTFTLLRSRCYVYAGCCCGYVCHVLHTFVPVWLHLRPPVPTFTTFTLNTLRLRLVRSVTPRYVTISLIYVVVVDVCWFGCCCVTFPRYPTFYVGAVTLIPVVTRILFPALPRYVTITIYVDLPGSCYVGYDLPLPVTFYVTLPFVTLRCVYVVRFYVFDCYPFPVTLLPLLRLIVTFTVVVTLRYDSLCWCYWLTRCAVRYDTHHIPRIYVQLVTFTVTFTVPFTFTVVYVPLPFGFAVTGYVTVVTVWLRYPRLRCSLISRWLQFTLRCTVTVTVVVTFTHVCSVTDFTFVYGLPRYRFCYVGYVSRCCWLVVVLLDFGSHVAFPHVLRLRLFGLRLYVVDLLPHHVTVVTLLLVCYTVIYVTRFILVVGLVPARFGCCLLILRLLRWIHGWLPHGWLVTTFDLVATLPHCVWSTHHSLVDFTHAWYVIRTFTHWFTFVVTLRWLRSPPHGLRCCVWITFIYTHVLIDFAGWILRLRFVTFGYVYTFTFAFIYVPYVCVWLPSLVTPVWFALLRLPHTHVYVAFTLRWWWLRLRSRLLHGYDFVWPGWFTRLRCGYVVPLCGFGLHGLLHLLRFPVTLFVTLVTVIYVPVRLHHVTRCTFTVFAVVYHGYVPDVGYVLFVVGFVTRLRCYVYVYVYGYVYIYGCYVVYVTLRLRLHTVVVYLPLHVSFGSRFTTFWFTLFRFARFVVPALLLHCCCYYARLLRLRCGCTVHVYIYGYRLLVVGYGWLHGCYGWLFGLRLPRLRLLFTTHVVTVVAVYRLRLRLRLFYRLRLRCYVYTVTVCCVYVYTYGYGYGLDRTGYRTCGCCLPDFTGLHTVPTRPYIRVRCIYVPHTHVHGYLHVHTLPVTLRLRFTRWFTFILRFTWFYVCGSVAVTLTRFTHVTGWVGCTHTFTFTVYGYHTALPRAHILRCWFTLGYVYRWLRFVHTRLRLVATRSRCVVTHVLLHCFWLLRLVYVWFVTHTTFIYRLVTFTVCLRSTRCCLRRWLHGYVGYYVCGYTHVRLRSRCLRLFTFGCYRLLLPFTLYVPVTFTHCYVGLRLVTRCGWLPHVTLLLRLRWFTHVYVWFVTFVTLRCYVL